MSKHQSLSLLAVFFFSLSARANVVGIDAQNFNPTSNGIDFVTVQSSETLEPGIINLGLFFNYAVNTLPNYENTSTQARDEPRDELVSMDFSIGLGLLENWDVGFTVPQLLWQNVDENSTVFRGQFETTGITEYRLNTKYRFFGDANGGLATILSANWFAVDDYPFTGENPGPTINLEVAYDFTLWNFNFGINLGYRFRDQGENIADVPVEPYPDQFLFSLASSYLVSSLNTKVIAEIFSSIPNERVQFTSDRELSSAEFLLGLKWNVSNSMAVHVGGGTELYQGAASPDWRAYTGINWNLGPLFGKQHASYDVAFLDEVDFNRTPVQSERFIAKDILFEFNSDQVTTSFKATMEKLATYLMAGNGFKSLVITGHTDSIGSASYNSRLSQRRAASVRGQLIQYLPPEEHQKVRAVGRGEDEPIADNGNFQGRALNRRVEFDIVR